MRIPVAIAAATALGLALAGCSNSEEPSTVKGTNPTVITGDQGAPGPACMSGDEQVIGTDFQSDFLQIETKFGRLRGGGRS